jgi:hypothetical protein
VSADAEKDSAAPARSRHRSVVLTLLAVAAMVLLALYWFTRPRQVADLILEQVGQALDLEIEANGPVDYRLGIPPRLVLHDVVARQPGAEAPLLRAERIAVSLPWSTIRSRGRSLVVERLEVDAPVIDLGALQHWLASRPPGPGSRIPTITDGVHIEDGRLLGDGWAFEAVTLDLPRLHPERPVRAGLLGRFRNGDVRIPFDLHVALTQPAADAGLGAFGRVAVLTPDWRMPMQLRLSGRLHDGDDGLGLDDFRAGALARFDDGAEPLPFVFGLAGPLRYRQGRLTITPLGVVVRGEGVIPTLQAHGAFAWQQQLDLRLQGRLAGWSAGWPTLPAPLDRSEAPLPFVLDYAGAADLSGRTDLHLERGATRFDARFHLPQVLDWLDQLATGNPLPPLDGRLSTPRLEVAGATLEGVVLEIENPEAESE